MALSRIGKKPIDIPSGVKVAVSGSTVTVEGPKGKLQHELVEASAQVDGETVLIGLDETSKNGKAMHGLARALVNNMVVGVSEGFSKTLEINGVGYRADLKGKKLELNLGFSHPVVYELPEGVSGRSISRLLSSLLLRQATAGSGCGENSRVPTTRAIQRQGCEVLR